MGADAAQQDLLLQVIDINRPSAWTLTAGEQTLYALPLPAAHLHLEPKVLRSALLTLAGPGGAL